jgi:hypothetical protein
VITVDIPTRLGPVVQLLGMTTTTPGLVITPGISGTANEPLRYSGTWTVTHQASGTCVTGSNEFVRLSDAQELADQLGDIGVDWTVPTAVGHWTDDQRAAARQVVVDFLEELT